MLTRYYHLPLREIRWMDEIQIQNRLTDLPNLFKFERHQMALAFWGEKKKGEDDGNGKPRGGGRRRNRER